MRLLFDEQLDEELCELLLVSRTEIERFVDQDEATVLELGRIS